MPAISNLSTAFALMHPAGLAGSGVEEAAIHTWTFEPGVIAPLVILIGLYAAGVFRLWRTSGVGAGIARWQAAAFAVGCLALIVALISPIDAMSDELSAAHMVQHELLMIVAAPLLVAALPVLGVLFALPVHARKSIASVARRPWLVAVWSAITAPAVVFLLHGVAVWVWHMPTLYGAALDDDRIHAAEHACFFISALLFWWGMTRGRYGKMGYGAAVIYVFATALHTGLLGAALTISPSLWYAHYAGSTTAWGLTPLEDQQLAGLIMWVPAGLVFTAMALVYFAAWIQESERRSRFASVSMLLIVTAAAGVLSTACQGDVQAQAAAMTGGDPARGKQAITTYGCDTCHVIPGVTRARGYVGPPLDGVANRVYLAGHLPNTPVNMQDWIQHPHAHDRQTVMPETGITPQDARDVSAYLYTLR